MALFYNGIEMYVQQLQEFTRTPVMHYHKVAYVRHVLKARVVINPQVTAYRYPARFPVPEDKDGVGVTWQGTRIANMISSNNDAPLLSAPDTERNLIDALTQPRRRLIYSNENIEAGVLGVEWLISPPRKAYSSQEFYEVDANNGPIPLGARIVKRHGNRTLEVDVGWQTDLAPCSKYSRTPSSVASHTWRMRRITDQDHFSTRIITGEVVFRTDRLRELRAKPDDFLSYLIHPTPMNMQRIRVEAYPSEDNTRVHYLAVDKELPFNLINWTSRSVTRIEAYQGMSIGSTAMIDKAVDIALFAGKTAKGFLGLNAQALVDFVNNFDVVGAATKGIEVETVKAATAAIGGALQNIAGNILEAGQGAWDLYKKHAPQTSQEVVVKVWGNRESSRRNLMLTANDVMLYALNGVWGVVAAVLMTTSRFSVSEDLMGKFVELRASLQGGVALALQKIIISGTNAGVWTPEPGQGMVPRDEIDNVTTSGNVVNPYLPFGENTRGTFTSALVSQALKTNCAFFENKNDDADSMFVSVPLGDAGSDHEDQMP